MVISRSATSKKTAAAPAKKSAPAPAKRTAPTAKPVTTKAVTKPVPAKVTGHDVARAALALEIAQKAYTEVLAQYWAQNDADLEAAVEHSEKAVESMTPPMRTGRKPQETPTSKTRAKRPIIDEFYDRDKVEVLSLRELRDLATDLVEKELITELKVKKIILAQMEEAGLFREAGDSDSDADDSVDDDESFEEDGEDEGEEFEDAEDAEDEDDDESEDDDEEPGITLEDLKKMKLKALQELAEQNGIDWEDMDKAELVDALWNQDEEEEADDESEDEDEEDEEEETATIEIDLADLPNMSVDELYKLAKNVGAKIPVAKRKNKDFLIEKIEEMLDEDEDEDDE